MSVRVTYRTHTTAQGEKILYVRLAIPERAPDGSIRRRHVERSSGTGKRVEARRFAEDLYQKAHAEAHRKKEGEVEADSFAAATIRYLRAKAMAPTSSLQGLVPDSRFKVIANKSYLVPILQEIGAVKVGEIDQAMVERLAQKLYPGRRAATVNRQLFTPIVAVLNHCGVDAKLKRPEGHDSLPELAIPKDDWYGAVLRVANPYLAAFILATRLTGRRPDEMLNRTREHYDPGTGSLLAWDNKGRQHILLQLPAPVRLALDRLPDLRQAEKGDRRIAGKLTPAKRAFLFGTNRKETMRGWLKSACAEAGVAYHMPKEFGRHAFVTRSLEEGKSLKWVQQVGRWKTLKVVAEKYGHLELQDTDRQAREAGEAWFQKMAQQPVTITSEASTIDAEPGDWLGDGLKKSINSG